MLHDLMMILLGAVVTYFGVIGGAIAERVRGARQREHAPRRPVKLSAPIGSERAAEWTDGVIIEKIDRRPAAQRRQKIPMIPMVSATRECSNQVRAVPMLGGVELTPVPMLNDVRDALIGLGYAKPLATQAAAEARRKLGDGAPLSVWIKEALQFCKPPVESVTSYVGS
jgi:hypothetical protein